MEIEYEVVMANPYAGYVRLTSVGRWDEEDSPIQVWYMTKRKAIIELNKQILDYIDGKESISWRRNPELVTHNELPLYTYVCRVHAE